VGKLAKKSSLKECIFINSALKITLLQTAFSAILPTGHNLINPRFSLNLKRFHNFANSKKIRVIFTKLNTRHIYDEKSIKISLKYIFLCDHESKYVNTIHTTTPGLVKMRTGDGGSHRL